MALERLRDDIARQSPDLDYAPLRVEIAPVNGDTDLRHGVIGRSTELSRLQGLLDRTTRGHGAVAVIRGISGMGKTTLASAVIEDGTRRGMPSAWSGQPADVREPPMWAWLRIIRRLAERADPPALERARAMAPNIFGAPSGHETTPPVHTTAGYVESRFEAPAEIASVIARLIGDTPTIVVLDDLHRADKASRAVLDVVTGSLQEIPLLIVVTWQDGAADRPLRPRVFDRLLSRSDVVVIGLGPLSDDASADLVRAETGVQATPVFVESLQRRTGGNPFYIRELVRLLHSQGHLHPTTTEVEIDGMPDAVVGVVRRRMSDLRGRTREALGVAGMMGVTVESRLLADVLQTTRKDLRGRLAPACRFGLLSVSTDWPQRYWFSHDVVREVAASEYPPDRKKLAHARIARTYAGLADTAGYDRAIAAAEHAWRAGGELEPEVASDLLDTAVRLSVSRSEYAEVAELTERALEMTRRLPEGDSRLERQARYWRQRASVLAVLRGHGSEDATAALTNAFDAGLAMSGNSGFTAAVALRCALLVTTANYAEAGALGEGLLTLYAGTGDPIAGAAGYYNRAVAAFMAGDLDAALRAADDLVDEVPAQTQDNILSFDVRVFGVAAEVYALRGDVDRARAVAQNGIDIARARGNGFAAAILSVNLLQVSAIVGDVAGTGHAAAELITDLQQVSGTADLLGSAHLIQAWARALEPGGPDTTSQIRDALLEHTAGGTRIFVPLYLMLLAEAEAEHGHLEQARSTLHRAAMTARASGERVWEQRLPARRGIRPAGNRLTESTG
ncbi:ATP-binding protein [Williamsia limnetica]|nr:AAA family ATPase [Williamsia limnetica]